MIARTIARILVPSMNTSDSALTGASRVLGLWILFSALIGVIWRTRLHATIDSWFLLCMFLGASGCLAPVYGGLIYFGARRRAQPRSARAAGIATIVLFIVGLAFAGFLVWMLKALGGLR